MALIIKDRVKEVTTTSGTGDITLTGSSFATFVPFNSYMTNGDTSYYAIEHTSSGIDEWEVGLGTWNTGNTLSRTTVLAGSAGTSAVDFSAGTKNIFMTYPSAIAAFTDGSGDLSSLIGLGNHTTTDVAEGSNLYFTTGRIDSHLSGGTGVTYNAGAISIGQAVGTTSNVAFNTVTLSGDITVPNLITSGNVDGRDISVDGTKLDGIEVGATADQTATEILTAIKTVDGVSSGLDADLLDGQQGSYYTAYADTAVSNLVAAAPSTLDTLNELAAALGDDPNFATTVTNSIAAKLPLSGGTLTGALTATGFTGPLTGNASTATALATGRTISLTGDVTGTSASFDGSGNVSIAATIAANSVALGTDTTGNYVAAGSVSGVGLSGSSASEGGTFTVTSNATNLNTVSTIVARDASGNFSAGTITAALSGNATTATTAATTTGNAGSATVLQTARNINGISFNGSANITVADATKLPLTGGAITGAITTTSTFDGRDVSVDGAKLDGIAAGANNYSFPYTVSAAAGNSTVVQRDGSGYIFAGYFNGTGTFSTTGVTSGMGRFTGTNGTDTYGRSYTAAAARTLLNVADGATNVTNTNQLTNGAGYITGYTETDTFSTVATRGNSYINSALGGISVGETFTNYAGWNTQLNVHGGPHCRLTVKTDTVQMGVYAHNTWNSVSGVTPGGFVGTYNDYPLSFLVNTSQKMVINTSGNVGIGVTSPTQKLDVNGTVNATAFSGSGASLTALNGTNISTGTVAAARVATLNQNTTGSSGSTTGNAATATTLQTARTINGVSFNGSANITVADGTKLPLAGGTMTGNTLVNNYGIGNVGLYSATKYQAVFAMGDAYKLPADGSTTGTLYGIAWTHSNIGGQSKAGLSHQALFVENGVTKTSIGTGIWTSGTVTATEGSLTLGGWAIDASLHSTNNTVYYDNAIHNFTGTISGSGASITSLNGSNISTGTVAAARVATLNQNTTGSAATLTTARTINGVSFNGSANITVADSTKAPLASPTFTGTATISGNLSVSGGGTIKLDGNHPVGTGLYNVALGSGALAIVTTGQGLVAIGDNALASNTNGLGSVAVGYKALNLNGFGMFNVAVGGEALTKNITGHYNVAVGHQALFSSTAGWNTAVGYQALYTSTTATGNTASGFNALRQTTTGVRNTATGYRALYTNTIGSYNSAHGRESLYLNSTGNYNAASGYLALYNNSTGGNNTALGYKALYMNTSGKGNTGINPMTSTGVYSPVYDPYSTNDRFSMGSTGITNAYIQVAWTVVSDARDKIDFNPVPHGLDFVNNLKPTAYRYKMNREDTEGHGPVRYGFKAQDVLALEGNSPVIVDAEDAEKLRFNDQSMIAVLVKSIQELSAKNDALEARLAALES